MIKTAFLAFIETRINEALELDPVTKKRLQQCDGAVIEVVQQSPDFHCYIVLDDLGVRCAGWHEGSVDARFEGKASSFVALATQRNAEWSEVSGLTVSGDQKLLAQLQKAHKDMELDWEAVLCQHTGVVVGHGLAEAIRSLSGILANTSSRSVEASAEYLQQELKLLPSQVELSSFSQEVESLSQAVNRLGQTINNSEKGTGE
ncbi:hypothetical protein EOPP23_03800 [Endozoicomonas sp. OPT23]|uniref:ubiquinone biosynthesis accessory factor UbiJ n=1 Tax=Endozoicomonas sp. OPT23 TaxID=2072845 RepID=UPI00129B502D|nr:SCP2 sterol-binding domain-containing protein [Endozoicomonas sp. OPT23]MRI32118.1 hypothetical protein [Endozoicomonas sp. OPT23]